MNKTILAFLDKLRFTFWQSTIVTILNRACDSLLLNLKDCMLNTRSLNNYLIDRWSCIHSSEMFTLGFLTIDVSYLIIVCLSSFFPLYFNKTVSNWLGLILPNDNIVWNWTCCANFLSFSDLRTDMDNLVLDLLNFLTADQGCLRQDSVCVGQLVNFFYDSILTYLHYLGLSFC